MLEKKIDIIHKITTENVKFTSGLIPKIYERLSEVDGLTDDELDSESKLRMIKSLQHQLGYLSAVQSESLKLLNMLSCDIKELEVWVKATFDTNEKFGNDIQNTIDGVIEE